LICEHGAEEIALTIVLEFGPISTHPIGALRICLGEGEVTQLKIKKKGRNLKNEALIIGNYFRLIAYIISTKIWYFVCIKVKV
jgi:hypothetical protein